MKHIFPWYDSNWLCAYVLAKQSLQHSYPHEYKNFVAAMEPLRTRADFETIKIDRMFDTTTMSEIRDLIDRLHQERLEKHEFFQFGRFVVHDLDYFVELQARITPLVSDLVGEAVEPSYTFLCLYNNLGICKVHMDAPLAKYTLDVCIEQSHPWPIYFSQVRPWPEDFNNRPDWESAIVADPHNKFTAHNLDPGEAVIFSGSSQWHYRQPIPQQLERNFCHLVFCHFIPAGMSEILQPKNWATIFNIPEFEDLFANYRC